MAVGDQKHSFFVEIAAILKALWPANRPSGGHERASGHRYSRGLVETAREATATPAARASRNALPRATAAR